MKYSENEKKELGKKIKKARKHAGFSLKSLGKKIGYSYSLISEWENGKKIPNSLTLIRLKKILNMKF